MDVSARYIKRNHKYPYEIPPKQRGQRSIQPSFGGISYKQVSSLLFSKSEEITTQKALKEVKHIFGTGKHDGIDFIADKLKNANESIKITKSATDGFIDALLEPFRILGRMFKRIFGSAETKKQLKAMDEIVTNRRRLTGYLLKVKQQSKRFDEANIQNIAKLNGEALAKFLKDKNLDPKAFNEAITASGGIEQALKNPEELKKKYIRNFINDAENKKLGSFFANFSNDHAQFVNRITSGATTAFFLGNDFYNYRMARTGNKEEAEEKRNLRYKQYGSYVALTAYLGYVLNSTFSRAANKSLPIAIGLGAVIAASSNILSRAFNGMPLLPKKHKDASNDPYVIHATPINDNIYASPLNAYNSFKGNTDKQPSFSGRFDAITNAKIPYKEIESTISILRNRGTESSNKIADKILQIAGKNTVGNEKASLEEIKNAAVNGEVIIGKNTIERVKKALINFVKAPYLFLKWAGRQVINLGRKIAGKPLIEPPKVNKFDEAKYVQNVVKNRDNIGKILSSFQNTNVIEYPADSLSTAIKATGLITIPFLAVDAYNETMDSSKNEHISTEMAKHRALQDTTRQLFSLWAVKGFNDVFKGLLNSSLLGNSAGVVANVTGYETLTRKAVGQPILPKTQEEMREIEKKRYKDKNWFFRALGGKIKVHHEENKVTIGSAKLHPATLPLGANFKYLGYNSQETVKNRK